jgi:prepilin-type N-terminal cleavage/methylation domain-containing protein
LKKNNLLQKGFTLVEVMVAVGLLSIISYGLMSIITNATKQQKSIVAKDAMRELSGEIRGVLSNPLACTRTFATKTITLPAGATPKFSTDVIKDSSNNDKFVKGLKYQNDLLQITGFEVSDLVLDAASIPVTGVVKLNIIADKTGDIQGSRSTHQFISLKVTFNGATSDILDCVALSAASESIWKLATNLIDIYFNSGNVGIGTVSPGSTLSIVSSNSGVNGMSIHTISGSPITSPYGIFMTNDRALINAPTVPGSSGVHGIEVDYLGNFRIERPVAVGNFVDLTITPTGNVGIGTAAPSALLHVQGPAAGNVLAGPWVPNNAYGFISLNGSNSLGSNFYSSPGDSNLYINRPTGAGIAFRMNNADQVRIDAAGNVGIGTIGPSAKLEVAGNIKPGHAGVTTGAGGCSPEGSFAYDMGNHVPVFCNSSGHWATMGGGGVPRGTPCGVQDDFGWYHRPCIVNGVSYMPRVSCPPGYVSGGLFGSNSDNTGSACFKNID